MCFFLHLTELQIIPALVSFITNSISRNLGTFRKIAISKGGRMKTRKCAIREVESFDVRNWRGLNTASSRSVEMLIIRNASNDNKIDLKVWQIIWKMGDSFLSEHKIPHRMPEVGVKQSDWFCHVELFLSQNHSQKDYITHTEGT